MDLSRLLPVIDQTVRLDGVRERLDEARPLMLGVSDGAKAAEIGRASCRERVSIDV